MTSLDVLLRTISQAPASQLNPKISKEISQLIGGNSALIAVELRRLHGQCVQQKLASAFTLNILDQAVITAENYDH